MKTFTPSEELYYDIIISDFGRKAAVDYLSYLELYERQSINKLLNNSCLEFFDEYRRIMINFIAEINFLKEKEIETLIKKHGYITKDILFGVGDTKMSDLFFDKLLQRIIIAIQPEINTKYKNIRISIICNSLSPVIEDIVEILNNEKLLASNLKRIGLTLKYSQEILKKNIFARTVPKGVYETLKTDKRPILILGVKNAVKYYQSVFLEKNIEIIELDESDYQLIDEAVVVSISNKIADISKIKKKIKKQIVEKHLKKHKSLVVVEACTDFDFGVGRSSLELFAKQMVNEVYS